MRYLTDAIDFPNLVLIWLSVTSGVLATLLVVEKKQMGLKNLLKFALDSLAIIFLLTGMLLIVDLIFVGFGILFGTTTLIW